MQHTQKVNDRDPYFEIDAVTRKIVNKSSSKVSVIQYDHNSERFTFSLPRYIEDHDMLESTKAEVHYICAKSQTKGIYEMTDLAVDPEDENKVICTWLLSQNVTLETGAINFLLRFSCVAEDGTLEYAWNTAIFTGISVDTGIYNTEAIIEQYADILEQWKKDLFSESAEGVENINTAKDAALKEIGDKQDEVEAASAKAVEDINTAKNDAINTISEIAGGDIFANALKGSASGELVSITDVSPVEHTVSVQLSSDTITDFSTVKVTVCGKNILNPKAELIAIPNNYYLGVDINNLANTYGGSSVYMSMKLKEGKTIPAGINFGFGWIGSNGAVSALWFLTGGKLLYGSAACNASLTIKNICVCIYPARQEFWDTVMDAFDVQLELGGKATEYEPFNKIAEYTSNADGTVENVKSIYPTTTLLTNVQGISIDCEYNRDINKAFAELQNAIISLGGNI